VKSNGKTGTGYFGCRDDRSGFDGGRFTEKANLPEVKLIEIKLSQGAKLGQGGVLPAAKNTVQIAKIRGVLPNTTIFSPPNHSAFEDNKGSIAFISKSRALSNVKTNRIQTLHRGH